MRTPRKNRTEVQERIRCQYRDPFTGLQCINLTQREDQYCLNCKEQIRKKSLVGNVQTVLRKSQIRDFVLLPDAKEVLPKAIQEDCIRFLIYCNRQITISDAIVFGSYAQHRAHQWSDVDLAVISTDFVDISFLHRTIMLRRVAIESHTLKVQALGLTPKQLSDAKRPAIISKVRSGMPILERKGFRRG